MKEEIKDEAKKLYWLIEDNGDLSNTCESPKVCAELIISSFDDLEKDEQEETQYTVTPVWLTNKEYEDLPEE